jgi:hypothetical protein
VTTTAGKTPPFSLPQRDPAVAIKNQDFFRFLNHLKTTDNHILKARKYKTRAVPIVAFCINSS